MFKYYRIELIGISALLATTTLPSCGDDKNIDTNEDSVVLTISEVNSELQAYALKYRLYCGTNEGEISKKIVGKAPNSTLTDSASITSLSFPNSDTKDLKDGTKCLLDIFSEDPAVVSKFKWNTFDIDNKPKPGVFYISEIGTVTAKKLPLTLYETYVNTAETFEVAVETTYPSLMANKKLGTTFLTCGSTAEGSIGETTSVIVDSNSKTMHKFSLRKLDFKENDHSCTIKSTVDEKQHKSTTAIKIPKNPDGKKLDLKATLEIDNSTQSATNEKDLAFAISFENAVCDIKNGSLGCSNK